MYRFLYYKHFDLYIVKEFKQLSTDDKSYQT